MSQEAKDACLDGLDWTAIMEEFTCQKFLTGRSLCDVAKHFYVVLLLCLLPSGYDIISDYLLANAFVDGTTYIKHITTNLSQHQPGEGFTPDENCRHIGSYYENTRIVSLVKYEKVECLEKDPIWGWTMFGIMLLPGLLGGYQVWEGLDWCIRTPLILFIWPFFPLIFVATKTVALFNPGK